MERARACRYISPVIRSGYSTHSSGYVSIGNLFPVDREVHREGGFSERGIELVANIYANQRAYDLGYAERVGWLFLTEGWSTGVSFSDADKNRKSLYLSYSFGIEAKARYQLDAKNLVLEIGLKY